MSTGELTLKHKGWIQKVTRKIWSKMGKAHSFEDLLSIAYIAALEAEKVYNPDKAKFSTYIKPRIEGALTRSISNISNHQHKLLIKMYAFIDRYVEKHERVPAQHIILKHLDINEKQFLNLIDTINEQIIGLDTVEDTEIANTLDMDTIAEFDKVERLVKLLPPKEYAMVQQYLEDPTIREDKIQHILDNLRKSLKLVKKGGLYE